MLENIHSFGDNGGGGGGAKIPTKRQLIDRSSLTIPGISKLYGDINILRISLKCQ